MAFIGIQIPSPMRFTVAPKKKLAVPPEIPKAKIKVRGSADKVITNGAGKSTLPETSFPIAGTDASAGGLEALIQARMEAAHRQYADLYDFAPVAYFTLTRDGAIQRVNLSASNLLGVEGGKLLKRRFGFFVDPQSRPDFVAFLETVFSADGKKQTRKVELPCRGKTKSFWAQIEAVSDDARETCRAVVVDVSERKHAAESLRESEAKYRTILENIEEGYFEVDLAGNFTFFNESVCRLLGYTQEEMMGMNNRHYTDGANAKKLYRAFNQVYRTGNPTQGSDWELIRKDGAKRYVECSVSLIKDKPGQPIGFRGILRDITEHKQAEEALKESESLYRKMNENSPLGMHFYKLNNNDQLVFVGANPAADKLLGVGHAQFVGKTIEEAFPSLMQTEVPASYRDAAAKGLPWSTEQISYDDKQIKGAFDVRAFQTIPGNMVAVFANITERKRAEDELRRAKETLEALNIELQAALAREQQLARTDVLTGINNRRCLFELAEHDFEIAVRYQQPLSAILFDIDHFKDVNDTFGHALGDQMLQRVVQAACAELRSADVIGRYGGEEFVILLPLTDAQDAHSLAERIRAGVAALRLPTETGEASVTLSLGIAEMMRGTQICSAEELIRRADQAMYAAKQAGRNCTVISEQ